MSIRVPVNPDTYFRDFARNSRAPNNGREINVKLTEPHNDWIRFAQQDVPGQDSYSKLQIASLAVMFGASRPMVAWGYPVQQFGDIAHQAQLKEMEGEIPRSFGFGPMDSSREHKVDNYPQTMRVPQNTMDLIDQYERLLRASRSVVVRHLMAISFRWYSREVFDREQFVAYSKPMDPYLERLKAELDMRIEYANTELNMTVPTP